MADCSAPREANAESAGVAAKRHRKKRTQWRLTSSGEATALGRHRSQPFLRLCSAPCPTSLLTSCQVVDVRTSSSCCRFLFKRLANLAPSWTSASEAFELRFSCLALPGHALRRKSHASFLALSISRCRGKTCSFLAHSLRGLRGKFLVDCDVRTVQALATGKMLKVARFVFSRSGSRWLFSGFF